MLAPTRSGVSWKSRARTGAPAMASTTFIPTARSSVLLPDMLEPLTSRTRVSPRMLTSLRTQRTDGTSGCPSSSPSNDAAPSANSGDGSAGCSKLYVASESSASICPIVSTHIRRALPCAWRQCSAANATCTEYMSGASRIRTATLCRELIRSTKVRSRAIAREAATRQKLPLQCLQLRSLEPVRLHPREYAGKKIEVAKCVLRSVQHFFQRLLEAIGKDGLDHNNQHQQCHDSPNCPDCRASNGQCREQGRQPSKPQRLHLVWRFRPLQQRVGMNAHTNIFSQHRQILSKVVLIAQLRHGRMPLADLLYG